MTALAADRNTPQAISGDIFRQSVAASQLIYAGAMVARNAAGDIVKGATSASLIAVGRAEERADNSTGSAGDKSVTWRKGIFRFANSASGDLITKAEIGKVCWMVDDQTVAKTSNSSARSRAGVVRDVDAQGVWVELDEALARVGTVTAA
jgi:hypothetical protein